MQLELFPETCRPRRLTDRQAMWLNYLPEPA
jgi:hypothetical protein